MIIQKHGVSGRGLSPGYHNTFHILLSQLHNNPALIFTNEDESLKLRGVQEQNEGHFQTSHSSLSNAITHAVKTV